MIFEILEIVSALALVAIAVQLSMMVRFKRLDERTAVVRRTHQEVYRNNEPRNLIAEISARSISIEMNVDQLLESDPEFRAHVREMLGYFEYLAHGVSNGIFDEHLVRTAYGRSMTFMYTQFERYIKETRQQSNNPETYKHFKLFVDRLRE